MQSISGKGRRIFLPLKRECRPAGADRRGV
jgi:hypothetical protein